MSIDISKFSFKNNLWECIFPWQSSLRIFVDGDEDYFKDPANVESLELLMQDLDKEVFRAIDFAMKSAYRTDITRSPDMQLSMVHVKAWNDYRIWFSLGCDRGKKLAVDIINSKAVDVYCDH